MSVPSFTPAPIDPTYNFNIHSREIDASTDTLYVRFQRPLDPSQSNLSPPCRVNKLDWDSTPTSVRLACENYSYMRETDDQLWRELNATTLQYADYYASQDFRAIYTQSGLNGDDVAVSFILPTAVRRSDLHKIYPDDNGWSWRDKEATMGIFGLNGRVEEDDYAYTTGAQLKEAVADFKKRNKDVKTKEEKRGERWLYLAAITSGRRSVCIKLELLYP